MPEEGEICSSMLVQFVASKSEELPALIQQKADEIASVVGEKVEVHWVSVTTLSRPGMAMVEASQTMWPHPPPIEKSDNALSNKEGDFEVRPINRKARRALSRHFKSRRQE